MDRYASVDEYRDVKERVFAGDGAMVLNLDDAEVARMHRSGRYCSGFTMAAPTAENFGVRAVQGNEWLAHGHILLARVDALALPGRHNVGNALAALALGHAMGLSMVAMMGGLLEFSGLMHRCELIAQPLGVRWFNDSKGTNVGATCAAIRGLGGSRNVVLIAGGEGKDADFSPLAGACAGRVKLAVLYGQDAGRIADAIGHAVAVTRVSDLNSAVAQAHTVAREGDVVLFSPACASFDMFSNYEERGRALCRPCMR